MQVIWFIIVLLYGLSQLVIGFGWVGDEYGIGWSIALGFVTFIFRFTLPLTICVFFGVIEMFDWHWFAALLFTAPGLIFMFSALLLALFEGLNKKNKYKEYE